MNIQQLREECYLGGHRPDPWWMHLSFFVAVFVVAIVPGCF